LRLIAKGIGDPVFPIVRTLELYLIAPSGHDAEQAISIGNTKWLKRRYRRGGQRQRGEHPDQLRGCGIENPDKHDAAQRKLCHPEITNDASRGLRLALPDCHVRGEGFSLRQAA
jgi:hypothetical protein